VKAMLKIDADPHGRPNNDGAGTAFAAGAAELGELQAPFTALHQSLTANERYGSAATDFGCPRDVRFSPSGHAPRIYDYAP